MLNLFFAFLLFFLLILLFFTVFNIIGELIGFRFKESNDVEGCVSFYENLDLVLFSNEEVEVLLRFLFGEVHNKEFLVILSNPKAASFFGGRSQHNIGE